MQINPLNEIPLKSGTSANLTSYSSVNPYIAPCDGYIFAQSTSANELIDIYILTPNGTQVGQMRYTTPYNYTYYSFYVPKGMKLYGTASAGSPIYFNGIN